VLERLTEVHDVFAPNLPGHVGGPPAPVELNFRGMADAVERQLDSVGIETAHMAGNSMGATVGLELARRGRTRSMVAFSPPGCFPRRLDRIRAEAVLGVSLHVSRFPWPEPSQRLPATVRRALLSLMMDEGHRVPGDYLHEIFSARRANATFALAVMAHLRRDPVVFAPFEQPSPNTLLAWGDNDRVLPYKTYGLPMVELIPGSQFAVLANAGHVPMFDNPQLVADTILSMSSPLSHAKVV
jgi:pimeloyl-ACP methyl ester carboxylesterase